MTVVMCDIVGSTKLAARLDPEEFAALLVAYRERCSAVVAQYGGYISRYVGDGVLACFGYPRATGRDAHAAVACGLAVVQEIESLAADTVLHGGGELAVRVGIETGVVIAGRLGTDAVMELDALVGAAPNIAAHLQELAPTNGVAIGPATHELVRDDYLCEEVAVEHLSRIDPPIPAFVVLGQAEGRRRLVHSKRNVPLVGRDAELELILRSWGQAASGQGRTVLLSGEPGIGKSRLAQELLDQLANTKFALIVLTCKPLATGTALHPVIEALHEEISARVQASGEPLSHVDALSDLVREIGLERGPTLDLLGHALGLGSAQTGLAPAASRRLVLKALQSWLLHRSDTQPLLILAEDLHWSDPSLLELLRDLSDIVPTRRAMLLATYRTQMVLPWPDRSTTLRIALPPLNRVDSETLLNFFQVREQSRETREEILERADGIPLFLEEFSLAAGTPIVPRSLQQLFTARLDALGDTRPLAQCAAILAPFIDPDILAALADVSEDALDEGLRRLVDAEVLARSSGPTAAGSYSFRHAVLQEAARDSLLGADRRKLHTRAATLLARLRPELATQQPEALAEQYLAGGQFATAASYYAAAARKALGSAALDEAETNVRRGLSASENSSDSGSAQLQLDLLVLLGHVLIAKRGYANAVVQEAFESALGAAERVHAEALALPALRGLASFYQVRGPLSRAARICGRLVAGAEAMDDLPVLVDAWRRRGWNRVCMGQLADGVYDLERALASFDPSKSDEYIATAGHDPQVLALANLCWLAPARFGLDVAATHAGAAATAAKSSLHAVSACYGLVFAALILQRAALYDEALDLIRQAESIAAEKGFAYWTAMVKVAAGYDLAFRCRNPVEGRDAIRDGMRGYRETQGELLRPFILSRLAEVEGLLGGLECAQAAIQEAIDVATALEARGFLPELLLQRAQLLSGRRANHLRRELLEQAARCAREHGAEAAAQEAATAMQRI